MKSHILFYSDNAPIGGVHQFNHSLICGLAKRGYKVSSVQLSQSNSLVKLQRDLGVKQYWLESDFLSGCSRSYTDLETPEKLIMDIKPDLIFFSDGWPLGNFAAKQIAIKLCIPYIISVGYVDSACSTVERSDGIKYSDAVRFQYTMSEAVVAVSQDNLDLLYSNFRVPRLRSKVIYYGRPESYFLPTNSETRSRIRNELNIPCDAVVCLTSARFAFVKGYDLQIEMIKLLQKSAVWDKLHFLWAGGGIINESVEMEIRQSVSSLGFSDKIHFLGERSDIPELLDASDIYILPSRAEGMPLAIMEAMAKGLPVVATAVSGIPEELETTGKLLPNPGINANETIFQMFATVELWANNPDLRLKVGLECRHRAETLFREDIMIKEYLALTSSCLCSKIDVEKRRSELLIEQNEFEMTIRSINFACLIWKAWSKYETGELEEMKSSLIESLEFTPFLRFETLAHWMDSFNRFYSESNKEFSSYELCNSIEWKSIIEEFYLNHLSEN